MFNSLPVLFTLSMLQVTGVEVVSNVGADQSAEHIFSPLLQYFSGILAVGTRGGHIYLIGKVYSVIMPLGNGMRMNENMMRAK